MQDAYESMEGNPLDPLNGGDEAMIFSDVGVRTVAAKDGNFFGVETGLFLDEIENGFTNCLPRSALDYRLAEIDLAFGVSDDVVVIDLKALLVTEIFDDVIMQRWKLFSVGENRLCWFRRRIGKISEIFLSC